MLLTCKGLLTVLVSLDSAERVDDFINRASLVYFPHSILDVRSLGNNRGTHSGSELLTWACACVDLENRGDGES